MTYVSRTETRDYQRAALTRMEGRAAFALLMRPRTGKTKVLLDDFGRLEQQGLVDDLLVIAPAGAYHGWRGEIDKHLSRPLRSRVRVEIWESGAGKRRLDELRDFVRDMTRPRILLMNVEALSTVGKPRQLCLAFLNRKAMVAVDESIVIKNASAKRTQFISGLRHLSKFRRILSGLPSPRSPFDLYSQFEFLDPAILGQPTFSSFQHHYAVMEKRWFANARWPTTIVKTDDEGRPMYRNLEELRQRVDAHSFKMEFRPDIPSTYSIREVQMTQDQERVYREVRDDASSILDELGSTVSATQVIVQMMRLHQVLCGHVRDENGALHSINENKTTQLLELLSDYPGKAIIWCSYDHSVRKVSEAIAKEFGDNSVARFWGGNASTREEEESRFKNGGDCRFMVATPAAGGRGKTWDMADMVIYYSSTNDLEHRDQSEQRSLNVGKDRRCDYVDLICPGTVEEKILNALRGKIDMVTAITGETWREWVV